MNACIIHTHIYGIGELGIPAEMDGPRQHLLVEGVGDEYVDEHKDRGDDALGPELEDIQHVGRRAVAQLWLASERKFWCEGCV